MPVQRISLINQTSIGANNYFNHSKLYSCKEEGRASHMQTKDRWVGKQIFGTASFVRTVALL